MRGNTKHRKSPEDHTRLQGPPAHSAPFPAPLTCSGHDPQQTVQMQKSKICKANRLIELSTVKYLLTYVLIHLLTYLLVHTYLHSYCKANGTKPDSTHKRFIYLLLEVQRFCKGSSIHPNTMDDCTNRQCTNYSLRRCADVCAVCSQPPSAFQLFCWLYFLVVLGSIVIFCGSSDASRRTFAVLCSLGSSFVVFLEVLCGPVRCLVVPILSDSLTV